MSEKPSIFIGSSSEGLEVAQAIQFQLKSDANVTVWNEGLFGLSQNYLQVLTDAVDTFDFAILVFRAEDKIISRGVTSTAARGNVIFELGLFMGRLGPTRTFVVYDNHHKPDVISDLAGISFASYDGSKSDDILSAVGPACFLIRQEIIKQIKPPRPDEVWYTEWRLGSKLYKETLELYKSKNYISGIRTVDEGTAKNEFTVVGFEGMGIYWLEYHLKNGAGGGTLLLHHMGSGKLKGLITAGDCDTGAMRCYSNRWVLDGDSENYEEHWLVKLGEIK